LKNALTNTDTNDKIAEITLSHKSSVKIKETMPMDVIDAAKILAVSMILNLVEQMSACFS
jgi:hypothetical protein